MNVLRTCQEYSERGITKSGIFTIDPDGDGVGLVRPIDAYCNFQTNETSIFHDKEDIIKVCSTFKGLSLNIFWLFKFF